MNHEATLFLRAFVLILAGMVVLACSLPWLHAPKDSLIYKVASRVSAVTGGCIFAVALFMVSRLLWMLWNVAG